MCADVRAVDNRTGVIIVQHPRERHHPFGTERFARLGLRRVQVRVCGPWDTEALERASALPPNTALLYPSPDAREVGGLAPHERPDHIVLVDATWHHAKTVVRAAPWLRALPRIRLAPAAPSEYRVRREPQADYLSTLEATVAALRALEPETPGLEGLLDAFRTMVDRQLERSSRSSGRRLQAPRRQRTPLPRAFTTHYDRVVVVYGETVKDPETGRTARALVYWCAARPATGETLARFVRPARAEASSAHAALMGLSEAQLRGGQTPERFRHDWSRFLRPDDIVVAWKRPSLDAIAPPRESLVLKGIVCNLIGRGCGHLEDFVRRAGLSPVSAPFEGRAGAHMSSALAVVEHLHRLGAGEGVPFVLSRP